MKISKMAKAMNYIEEDLLQEALEESGTEKKKHWGMGSLAAACICLLAGLMMWRTVVPQSSYPPVGTIWENDDKESSSQYPGITVSEEGVTIPPMVVDLSKSGRSSAEMIGFFIYRGRCYVQYMDIYEDVDLIDQHLGTITGMIDEWTLQDGYVDYAGSVTGEFYSVKGYDPSFMLCMKRTDGAISTFICNTGITLKYGQELFEDRMHLSENLSAVQYESRASWFYSQDQLYELDAQSEVITEFIGQLNGGEFVPYDAVPLAKGASYLSDMEEYHLYLRMNHGVSIHLRLYQGGYVRFEGMMDVFVRISGEVYEALTTLLDHRTGTPAAKIPDRMGVTLEECHSDPDLGAYVPEYTADPAELQAAYIHYYIEPKTGQEIGTREIYLDYQGPEDHYCSYSITINWESDHEDIGWGAPLIDRSELSLEIIEEHMKPYKRFGELVTYGGEIHLGVGYGDVRLAFHGWGLDEETVLQILESVQ